MHSPVAEPVSALLRKILPRNPALIAAAGLPPTALAVFAAGGDDPDNPGLVDLDLVDPAAPLSRPASGAVVVIARSHTDLRRAASLSRLLPPAKHMMIAVCESAPHHAPVLTKLPPESRLRYLVTHIGENGDWVIEAKSERAFPVGHLLVVIVQGIDGRPPARILRVALAGPGAAHWRPGDPGVVLTSEVGPLEEPNGFIPADLVLRIVGPRSATWTDDRVLVLDRAEPVGDGGSATARTLVDHVPPVDERSVNPIGFLANPTMECADLVHVGDSWSIRSDGLDVVTVHPSGTVTDADIAKLRQLRTITIKWGEPTHPIPAVRTVASLAMAGVPLCATHVPDWAGALGGDLVDLISEMSPSDMQDVIRREEHSIRLRRTALRTHSTRARWRSLALTAGTSPPPAPSISVVLCTRRAEYIAFALAQIARQRYVDLEVILTLHGLPADLPEVRTAICSAYRWPLTVVEAPGDATFGEALNCGAGRASGRYLAKWDDDDWYGPEFLADAMLAVDYSGADLVGCLHQLIYLERINLTIRRPGGESERWSRRISGNSLVMNRQVFDTAGGFPPIARSVDTGLLRSVEGVGGRIFRTHGMASMVYRRESGHTWNQPITTFLRQSERQWRGFRPGVLIEADEITDIPAFRAGGTTGRV